MMLETRGVVEAAIKIYLPIVHTFQNTAKDDALP